MAVNMSYCRFHNTLAALAECDDALKEYHDQLDELDELSDDEKMAAKMLIELCLEMSENFAYITSRFA